jgi:hypothetical protein
MLFSSAGRLLTGASEKEAPTALRMRPTVTIRHIPGKMVRVPARSGTLMLIAIILWSLGVALIHLPWYVLAGVILIPAGLLALLVELKPHGKSPLGWAAVLARHWRRASTLVARRLATRTQPHDRRR